MPCVQPAETDGMQLYSSRQETLMLEISRQESNEHQISEWSRNHQLRYITAAKLTLNVFGASVFYVQLQSDT